MNLAGEIAVQLVWNGHAITSVDLASTRPLLAARLLIGKTPAQVQALVPALFSLCGQAQSTAAELALANAQHEAIWPNRQADFEARVMIENLAELFWRLLLDWPQTMGQSSDPAPVAQARKLTQAALAAPAAERQTQLAGLLQKQLASIATEHLFGEAPATWLQRKTLADFEEWLHRATTPAGRALRQLRQDFPALGRTAIELLPVVDQASLEAELLPGLISPDFESHPRWRGQLAETGALARQRAQPLIAALLAAEGQTAAVRITARLVELASLLSGVRSAASWTLGFSPADSVGVGAVQTARGLLLHHLSLHQGRVAHYRIVAPTEWNFDPAGALSQGLIGQVAASANAARQAARILVQALDPCVACRVELSHA